MFCLQILFTRFVIPTERFVRKAFRKNKYRLCRNQATEFITGKEDCGSV